MNRLHPWEGEGKDSVFGNLLQAYGCNEETPPEKASASGQDGNQAKKRKLVEPVVINITDTPDHSESSKPNSKQKAPRKKPLTITGLATAAYRVASLPPDDSVKGTLLDHLAKKDNNSNEVTGDVEGKPNVKSKPRKKPAKLSKKKHNHPSQSFYHQTQL